MSLVRAHAARLRDICRHVVSSVSAFALAFALAGAPSTAFAETAYGLTDANQLLVFDTAAPGTGLGLVAVTGLAPGESLVGIDFRPLNAQLYGVGATGRLYVINPHNGGATVVGSGPWAPFAGTIFGVDFDPLADRIRVVSDADINVIVDPTTGAVTAQAALNPGNPTVAGLAYAAHVGLTTLYGIDTGSDQLVIFLPPQNGLVVNQGALGVNATGAAGFDITADHSGYGFVVLTVAGVPTLYDINLFSGTVTPIGAIAGGLTLRGFTLVSRPATLWSVDVNTQHLLRYRSIDPSAPLASIAIAGVQNGERITALDFRPDTGQLYGLGSTKRIYTLDTATGQATQVGTDPFVPALVGALSDMDFDPVTGQIRIVTVSGQNIRVNPDTGVAFAVTPIAAAVSGIAYTDNVPGASATTIYGYQATGAFTFELVRIGGVDGVPSADGGAVTPVANGPANPIVEPMPGLDIAAADGALFGSVLNGFLSKIDYSTGSTKSLGSFADSGGGVEGLAVELPGRLQLASTDVQVFESGPAAVITVNRVQSVSGVVTVDYAMVGVTADGVNDFTAASGTLIFMDGQSSQQIVIPIAQDALDEIDELFTVTLSNAFLGATILGPASVNVTIVDDDPLGSLPPTVTIASPTADPAYVSPSSVISLAGTAADDLGIAEVAWVNDRGGAGLATGTTDWSVPSIPLLPGQNVITVTATDTNGLVAQDTLTVTLNVKSYAFAEGATGDFFDTDLLLGNHYDADLPVVITYLRDAGDPIVQNLVLPPHSRSTVRVDEVPGMEAAAFSTIVDSSNGLPLAVERTQRWDSTGYGAHTEKGSDGPAITWYFAEGSQGFFQTYLLLGNPGGTTNQTTVRFLREGAPAVTKVYAIAPRSRLTVYAGDIPELVNQSFGIAVTFSQPGVAERAMYFGTRLFEGGHGAAGVTALSTTWFHAEGATGSFFTSFLLLANPGDSDAQVTLTYFLDAGAPIVVQKVVPASSRLTINLAFEAPAMANAAVATRVVSDVPIIAERAMYWPGAPAAWQDAHDSVGVPAAGLKWALAEGRVGGPSAAQTFILLANPGDVDAAVTIVYFRSNGTTVTKPYVVPASSRVNVMVNTEVPELANEVFSSLITADRPIFVERAVYADAVGVFWAAGTNATATPIP
jgi:hypothetical protein